MHAFRLEPGFQIFAGIRAELDEHFSFEHVDEDTLRARESTGSHALGEGFSSLACEASERVLGEIAWHRNSWEQFELQVFHRSGFVCTIRKFDELQIEATT
jgi:hypothetical protein